MSCSCCFFSEMIDGTLFCHYLFEDVCLDFECDGFVDYNYLKKLLNVSDDMMYDLLIQKNNNEWRSIMDIRTACIRATEFLESCFDENNEEDGLSFDERVQRRLVEEDIDDDVRRVVELSQEEF